MDLPRYRTTVGTLAIVQTSLRNYVSEFGGLDSILCGQIPLVGLASVVGVLEVIGGSWMSGQSFTCQLTASWPDGQVRKQAFFFLGFAFVLIVGYSDIVLLSGVVSVDPHYYCNCSVRRHIGAVLYRQSGYDG
jgi:hypothetical protein